ncbi:MAG: two-component system sensor histidine kinase NtrB [Promethearchaeota archaeon]
MRSNSKKIMKNVFYYSSIFNLVWLSNVLDAIWDEFVGLNFGPFYYFTFIFAIVGIYIADKTYFNIDFTKILTITSENLLITKEDKRKLTQSVQTEQLRANKKYILISCPICRASSYYKLSPEIQFKCNSSKGNLISIFIRRNITCKHTFIIYIDKNFDVRNYESLDYTDDIDLLLKNLPDLFFHIREDSSILDVFGNEQLLFKPKELIIGKKLTDILPKEVSKKVIFYLNQLMKYRKENIFSYSLNINGNICDFEARLIITSQNTILSTIRDITERRKAEEQILKERLKSQKIESISLLAGGIAHDLNNLLVSILGNANLLEFEENISDEGKDILKDLEQAGKRATDLTQQLLTFSKREKTIKSINSVVNILKDSISLTMRGSNSRAVVNIQSNIPDIEINPGQISQVFNNILINAKQAMPNGGIITISVTIVDFSDNNKDDISPGKYIKISIQDQGKGIPIEQQEHIFEPYFTTKSNGNGLGLASCYSIMTNHDGFITFSSEKNKGTRFDLYFLHS